MVIRFILISILFFFNFDKTNAIENKIIIKIDDKIISSIDLKNEQSYLVALNPNLKDLKPNELYEVAKKSAITDIIKHQEIIKYYDLNLISQEYIDKMIQNLFKSRGFENKNQFQVYLESNNVYYRKIIKKIKIQTVWNQLILEKYLKKVVVDDKKIRKEINELNKKITEQNSYKLSEILFKLENKNNVNQIYKKIEKEIKNRSFASAANLYSIAETATTGGGIGWVDQINLSKVIKYSLENLKIGEYSKPIAISGGYLILMIEDKKVKKTELNIEEQILKSIEYEKTKQLNQFSKIYYNKLKNNTLIDEK